MTSTQSQITALLESQAGAMRAKDIDRLMSLYSPDIVYFDVVPPLQYVGSAALREGSWSGLMAGRDQSTWKSAN
jgi:ketosteroid isomerase-like protein